jgi:ATP-dependent RNA helicase RhlE
MFNKSANKSIAISIDKTPNTTFQPLPSGFDGLGITQNITDAIGSLNFAKPTHVQEQAIPIGIIGKDLIAIAQTGSGKTLAFGIPMVQRLAQNKNGRGLIVVPTRELAMQVNASIQVVCRAHRMQTAVIIGGTPIAPQLRALKMRPNIIIATPGRLIDHLERKSVSLLDIQILVLDEADRMLDMGFAPAIKIIIKSLPKEHQTMLYSATMPDEIMTIARRYMNEPVFIEVDRSGAAPEEISHEIFFVDKEDKTRLLEIQLKERGGSVLVFTKTKHGAKKLTRNVNGMGYSAAEIHSNRTLSQRSTALEGFKKGKYRVLVATDIAARGLDVDDIMLVVNFDLPSTSEDYVHRIGRTGRAGKIGHAISFATFEQEKDVRNIEKLLKASLPVSALPFSPSGHSRPRLGRLAQQPSLQSPKPQQAQPSRTKPNREHAFGRRRIQRQSKRFR